MSKIKHMISRVQPGSIADEMELMAGDKLVMVNNKTIEDVLDYRYLINDEYVEILIEKENGEEWELEIEKEYGEDLGLIFENDFMDEYRSCRNRCIFCFIDQMPEGMRESLYFKDDDSRLSFLQGNYVTLTNMSDRDIERIIKYRLEPINISFHTMNPALRCEMLNNRFAGDALKKTDRLMEAGIQMNGQIVLCKGINDGKELEYSIRKLAGYMPCLQSVSVVPVGMTKYRDGLSALQPFTKEDAREILRMIHEWQEKFYREQGTHFIYAGDEWYMLAGREIPDKTFYDGYPQLENGVGMIRLFLDEAKEELDQRRQDPRTHKISIATGVLAYSFIKQLTDDVMQKFPQITIYVYPIKNEFFGEQITVSGLLTGQDLMKQLKDVPLGERLLLPCNLLRSGESVFLDDVTVEDLERTLQIPINIVKSSGQAFVKAVLLEDGDVRHAHPNEVNKYE